MTTTTTLTPDSIAASMVRLQEANTTFMLLYPGELGTRQPVHTVYGGAHLFKSDTTKKLGELAVRSMKEYAPDATTFAQALGIKGAGLAERVYGRVLAKIEAEAVEDFRIDFEDGYGNRPDVEEDGHAAQAALEVAKGLAAGTLSPFIGIRIKPFSEELRERSIRTLDIFITTLCKATGGKLPPNFVTTLPKIVIPEQVTALLDVFEALEKGLGLPGNTLKMESMIETTQSVFDAQGRLMLPQLFQAARGRMTGAHFGTYDYTACCNITAAYQWHQHPACDFARACMQVAYAGTGIFLSDGATTVMPVAPNKAPKDGALTPEQVAANRAAVHRAWKLHYDDVRHSLERAYYQGWDLHPGQLPTRYAAVYTFFLESIGPATERLKNFISKAAQATLVGDIFDDAATGQGLLNYFLRGVNCGALKEEEALVTGVTLEELRGRSFVKILKNRKKLSS